MIAFKWFSITKSPENDKADETIKIAKDVKLLRVNSENESNFF